MYKRSPTEGENHLMKRLTCLILATVLGISAAFVTNGIYADKKNLPVIAKNQTKNSVNNTDTNTLAVSGIQLSDYTVITPRAASYLYVSELQRFTAAVNEMYNCNMTIADDRQAETECEILVGITNRGKSQILESYNAFEILVSDGKIIINGGSDQATAAAIRYLTDNLSDISFTTDYYYSGVFVPDNDDYRLVWNDEFNADTFNLNTWTRRVQRFASAQGGYVKYTDSDLNTYVSDGTLKLASLRVDGTDDSYTCSYIHTADSMTFVYGIAEIRAKLPTGNGVWPAFWCNNSNTSTEAYQEIDIFEMFPGVTNRLEFAMHKWWRDYDSKTLRAVSGHESFMGKRGYEIVELADENIGDDWHTIGMIWTKEKIQITFDGYVCTEKSITGEGTAFFHSPVHFILNNFCGYSDTSVPDENTPFPNIFETDYIRLYQTDNEGKIYLEN